MDEIVNDAGISSPNEQHQQLSAVIKGLHRQLRRQYRESNGDHASVWENHTQNSASLQKYAQAMHCLATQHWAVHPDTRIQWCRQVALEYFTGGGMCQAIEKDFRRKMRQSSLKMAGHSKISRKEGDEIENPQVGYTAQQDQGEPGNLISDYKEALEEEIKDLKANIPAIQGRVWLLDVGSCYNPFQECPEFESLGIDLVPATESVYQCDFLKLEITPSVPHHPSSSDLGTVPLTSTLNLDPGSRLVTQLPRASFQVVVFSLLLEYLPAAVQRWECCLKAHSLLVPHGLLLIITPDSNSAYRNAPMMKSWRQALEHLGFQRWKYSKMAHVHCMAYRKVTDDLPEKFPESVENLLYIPQDFSDACYSDDHLPSSERASNRAKVDDSEHQAELETFLLSSAGELPLMCSDEEDVDS
ncbi:hypothetical protein ElyMa_001968200 [Elysia marginata]|uniref:S-adenosylmethionine sensor upstream of mTORC1 n=1 Tax=Elysia marginata TaxID=1093978 RepID=A0AAV4EZG0_9GAST|nr:hypothetical protein ElyMa_001968200 [Elysia marginata]